MRWMKHLTMAHADVDMGFILETFGAEAYGVWWLILEDIAAPMEGMNPVPASCHSIAKWASICHCSARVFRSIAGKMSELGLIDMQTTDNRMRIEVRNILKYKDEYSKKSGQTPEQEGEQKQKQKEKEKTPKPADAGECAKSPTSSPLNASQLRWFESEFWPAWPDRKNRPAAEKAAKKLSPADYPAVIAGVRDQAARIMAMERPIHAGTWLNGRRWEDEAASPQMTLGAEPYRSSYAPAPRLKRGGDMDEHGNWIPEAHDAIAG